MATGFPRFRAARTPDPSGGCAGAGRRCHGTSARAGRPCRPGRRAGLLPSRSRARWCREWFRSRGRRPGGYQRPDPRGTEGRRAARPSRNVPLSSDLASAISASARATSIRRWAGRRRCPTLGTRRRRWWDRAPRLPSWALRMPARDPCHHGVHAPEAEQRGRRRSTATRRATIVPASTSRRRRPAPRRRGLRTGRHAPPVARAVLTHPASGFPQPLDFAFRQRVADGLARRLSAGSYRSRAPASTVATSRGTRATVPRSGGTAA